MNINSKLGCRNFLAAALLPLITLTPLSAQITVDGTAFWRNQANADLGGTFDASGSDKLVFVATGEHGFNQTANGVVGNVFYDGTPLIRLVSRNPIKAQADPLILVDDTWNAIFYLDNPGDFHVGGVITTSGFESRGLVAVMALSGTAAGAGNTVIGDRDTNVATLTTSAGSIVIGSYGMGGTGNTAQMGSVTTPEWDVEVARQLNGNNWDSHVVAYQNNVAAGTRDYTFDDTRVPDADGRTGRHVIAAEFLSAAPAPSFPLTITANGPDFDLEWESQSGKLYNLLTSTDLSGGIATWELVEGNIEATPPANTYNVEQDGPRRFYAVEEFDVPPPPPIFAADFEENDGGFTVLTLGGTAWEHGAPNSLSTGGGAVIGGSGGSANAWGTNLAGAYVAGTDTSLRSPIIDLAGVTGAELSFVRSIDAPEGHTLEVNVIDAVTDTVIANIIPPMEDPDDTSSAWQVVGPIAIPAVALGQEVRIEWRFIGINVVNAYLGVYIDDVVVAPVPEVVITPFP